MRTVFYPPDQHGRNQQGGHNDQPHLFQTRHAVATASMDMVENNFWAAAGLHAAPAALTCHEKALVQLHMEEL